MYSIMKVFIGHKSANFSGSPSVFPQALLKREREREYTHIIALLHKADVTCDFHERYESRVILVSTLKQELTLFQPYFNIEGQSFAGWGESIGSDMTIIK